MQRRVFLRRLLGGTFVAYGGMLLPLGVVGRVSAASADGSRSAPADRSGRSARLVVVMLRGAVDGLSVVAPYSEPRYAELRPNIGLPAPNGGSEALLDLDGHFGLHPALASLYPLWQRRQLAFVHASGSPDPTRSHFDAQRYMETGEPGGRRLTDGWLNRMMVTLPDQNLLQVVVIGQTVPLILRGSHPVASLPSARGGKGYSPLDRPNVLASLEAMYDGDPRLAGAFRDGVEARRRIADELRREQGMQSPQMQAEQKKADNGAPLPNGLSADTSELGRLMRQNPRIRSAFIEAGGWDTHVNQGNVKGLLASRLKSLGEGLATLVEALGPAFDDTVIVVMSEFGRTAHENGNRGTDHGHGNVMWLLGGPIRGGKVYGEWPGLDGSALYEGRDLAITTDYRSVLAHIAERHLHVRGSVLTDVFPGFQSRKMQLVA